MDQILAYLQLHAAFLNQHKYLFLFIASCLEGFNTFIVAGFLIGIGTFNFWPAFFICLTGETLNGMMWYAVGYWAGAKPMDWFVRGSKTKKRILEKIRTYAAQYTGRVILAVKLTYSVTVAALILIGSLKFNFKKYALYNFFGSIGWVLITFALGLFFGQGYQLYVGYIRDIRNAIIFIVVALIFIAAIKWFTSSLFVSAVFVIDKIRLAARRIALFLEDITRQ